MKTSKNKAVFGGTPASKIGGAVSKVSKVIMLKSVTMEDRQQLRISSYIYLLP